MTLHDSASSQGRRGAHLQAGLANSGLVWATVASMPWQTNHGQEMEDQAVAVCSNGSDLAEIALMGEGQLVSLADRDQSVTAMPAGPQSREGIVPVYSRVEDRLFVVGGSFSPLPERLIRTLAKLWRWFPTEMAISLQLSAMGAIPALITRRASCGRRR